MDTASICSETLLAIYLATDDCGMVYCDACLVSAGWLNLHGRHGRKEDARAWTGLDHLSLSFHLRDGIRSIDDVTFFAGEEDVSAGAFHPFIVRASG